MFSGNVLGKLIVLSVPDNYRIYAIGSIIRLCELHWGQYAVISERPIGTAIGTGFYRHVSVISAGYTAPVSQKSQVQNLCKPKYFFQTLRSLLLLFKYMKFLHIHSRKCIFHYHCDDPFFISFHFRSSHVIYFIYH